MALTTTDLREFAQTTADFLNIRYFDGVLQFQVAINPRFATHWFMRVKATKGSTATIVINPAMCHASLYEIEEVLTHELIHVAQHALGYQLGHQATFRQIAKQFGIPTESSIRCSSMLVRTPRQMKAGVAEIPKL